MNVDLYNQLIGQFKLITEPLWELYGSYNGYSGFPILGTILLGLIGSTYPSQIAYHLGAITYITSQMRYKSNWLDTVISFFMGKLAGVYLIIGIYLWSEGDWLEAFLNGIRNLSIPLYLLLSISFFKATNRTKSLSFYKGFLISFMLSLIMDPKVFSIINLFTPWILNESLFLGWILPFLYVFASFVPIFIFSILGYGFNLDIFLKKNSTKKQMHYFFGFALIILAFNQLFLYWF
ncbi:hypothetical protein [Radiobacillus sp. PE A8.2]|uniref:hypothetical protein n=1 Tax=Radiobacillus sp. PE A8.2 TaxID=3380349 RepID=UPI0038907B66